MIAVPARGSTRRGGRGFSLLELLVATTVAGVVLAAAWAWCWSLCGACRMGVEGADATSTIAAVRRLSSAELGESLGLVACPTAPCSARGLAFVVPSADAAGTDLVTYGYDGARKVLWRKSPSSHLAEGVDLFSVVYLDARGCALPLDAGGVLPADELPLARCVELTLDVSSGGRTARATWRVCLPCPT